MKYAFVKMINPENGKELFISVRDFERYRKYPVFENTASSLVIMKNIYIAVFELIETFEHIKEFNDDVEIINEIPLTDICFLHNSIENVVNMIGDVNI